MSKKPKYYYCAGAIKEKTVTKDKSLRDRDNTKLNNCPGRSKMGGLVKNDYDYRNKRSVWTVATSPYKEAHFATFPEKLILPCVLAGAPEGGIVLDPFNGAGTTALVAERNNRKWVTIELNKEYCEITAKRIEFEREQLTFDFEVGE